MPKEIKMNKYLSYAPMAIFGIAGVSLYIYFMNNSPEGAFRDNLIPELLGFCLEGFFLIGLFPTYKKAKSKAEEKNCG